MSINYIYKYDYIPSDIVDKEENYNEERRDRIEESIDNILEDFQTEFSTQKIVYNKKAQKGEGILSIENLSKDMNGFEKLDKALGEIGLMPSENSPSNEMDEHAETPETKTFVQDKNAQDLNA